MRALVHLLLHILWTHWMLANELLFYLFKKEILTVIQRCSDIFVQYTRTCIQYTYFLFHKYKTLVLVFGLLVEGPSKQSHNQSKSSAPSIRLQYLLRPEINLSSYRKPTGRPGLLTYLLLQRSCTDWYTLLVLHINRGCFAKMRDHWGCCAKLCFKSNSCTPAPQRSSNSFILIFGCPRAKQNYLKNRGQIDILDEWLLLLSKTVITESKYANV